MENIEKLIELALLNINEKIDKLQADVSGLQRKIETVEEKIQARKNDKNDKRAWMLGDNQ